MVVGILLVAGTVGPAFAHPLGNFTTNTAVRVVVGRDATIVRYVVDLAEIPTTQERRDLDANDNDEIEPEEIDQFATARCQSLSEGLSLSVGDNERAIEFSSVSLTFPEGEAGLDTLRLTCEGQTEGIDEPTDISVVDSNFPDRIGWKEITVTGDEVTITDSDVPEVSPTRLLRDYPDSSSTDPLRTTSADLVVVPGGPQAAPDVIDPTLDSSAPVTNPTDEGLFERLTTRYTALIARQELTVGFVLLATGLAILLGASHAVAPGHGKTIIAAYIVGQKGSTRQALAIGATVALTHTTGTLLLGLALQLSESIAPENLYPFFNIASGALIIAIGLNLLRHAWNTAKIRRVDRELNHHDHGDHDHRHGSNDHSHGDHDHSHGDHDHGDHDHGHSHGDRDHFHGHRDHGHADHGDHDHGDRAHDHGDHDHDNVDHDGGDHGHGHKEDDHSDHDHDHLEGAAPGTIIRHHGHTHVIPHPDMRWRELITLGIAGGLAPSPSALLVLLGAIAIDRLAFGIVLVAAYGVGLALVLIGGGLLLVRFRSLADRLLREDRLDPTRSSAIYRVLPFLTGAAVIIGGTVLVVRGLVLS